MSSRQDQEREARLQPLRMEKAAEAIAAKGYSVTVNGATELQFEKNGNIIRYFPYSGWAQGRGITPGRGLKHLLKEI